MIKIIVDMSRNRVIRNDNSLIWHLPKSENEDLYKNGVKTILREYDEFLKRILC